MLASPNNIRDIEVRGLFKTLSKIWDGVFGESNA